VPRNRLRKPGTLKVGNLGDLEVVNGRVTGSHVEGFIKHQLLKCGGKESWKRQSVLGFNGCGIIQRMQVGKGEHHEELATFTANADGTTLDRSLADEFHQVSSSLNKSINS
jgi:hypothetical protein